MIMEKKIIFICYLIGISFLHSQTVTIPDSVFKSKLLESNSNNAIAKNLSGDFFSIDSNNDGEIQLSEAAEVSYLNLDFVSNPATLTSLDGIESFINLQTLFTYELAIDNFNYALPILTTLNLSYHLIENLDLRNLCSLESFETIQSPSNLANNSLKEIYLKNGDNSINNFGIFNGSDLNYVCVDSSELNFIQNALSGYSDITIDSSCSLTNDCATLSASETQTNDLSNVHLYPNPVVTSLIIKNIENIESILVFNTSGQKIINNSNIRDNKIDVSSIQSGLYFIVIKTAKKEIIRKFIRE